MFLEWSRKRLRLTRLLFENFRLRHNLEAGREAATFFWKEDVTGHDRRREEWSRKRLCPRDYFWCCQRVFVRLSKSRWSGRVGFGRRIARMSGRECLFPGRWGGRVKGFAPRDYKLARIYGRLIRRPRQPLTFVGHVAFAPVQEIFGRRIRLCASAPARQELRRRRFICMFR